MDTETAWKTEERLWLEGVEVYDEFVDPACLTVFPSMGVLKFLAVRESLKGVARWTSVAMMDRVIRRPHDNIMVLGYAAVGWRDGEEPYRCFCTSTYRADDEHWKLVQHQQTLSG